MSSLAVSLNLSAGTRWLFGSRLRKELALNPHAPAARAVKLISLKRISAAPVAVPLVDALKATEISTASKIFVLFCTVITLGIYLLLALRFVNCISSDRSSFYGRALVAMEALSKGENADPREKDSSEEEAHLPELTLSGENPIKDFCKELFEDFRGSATIQWSHVTCESACDLFEKLAAELSSVVDPLVRKRAQEGISKLYVAEADALADGAVFELFYSCGIRGDIPKLKEGVTVDRWNAFIVKLLQFYDWALAVTEHKIRSRAKFERVECALKASFAFQASHRAFAAAIAKKTAGEFQMVLAAAIAKPPLDKFFSLPQTVTWERLVFHSICDIISEIACKGECHCSNGFKLPLVNESDSSNGAIAMMPLMMTDGDFYGARGGEKIAAVAVINQLLSTLEAAVRRELAVTDFEFVLEFAEGIRDKAKRSVRMTLCEFCETVASEWEKEIGENSEARTRGQLLSEAEVAEVAAKQEFFKVMTESQVVEYMNRLRL
jgi:hypothetical protein